jgi:catechol 2,3-dioxygenase
MASPAPNRAINTLETPASPAAVLESENAPVFIRGATLVSRDAVRLAEFYTTLLGFGRIGGDQHSIALGAGGVAFLTIVHQPSAAPSDPHSTGLFHIAYLLPSRTDLARWFMAARAAGVPFEGASDHAVSEAFYLADPDGNGIEVYVDRDRTDWPREPGGYAMTTGPMALRDLVASAGESAALQPSLPTGTRIGHIHLQTGDAEAAAQFWQQAFGLEETHRRPGARFLSWGGYHHHIALNNWRSRGARPRDAAAAGLSAIDFSVRDEARLSELATEASKTLGDSSPLEIREPDGLVLRFTLA